MSAGDIRDRFRADTWLFSATTSGGSCRCPPRLPCRLRLLNAWRSHQYSSISAWEQQERISARDIAGNHDHVVASSRLGEFGDSMRRFSAPLTGVAAHASLDSYRTALGGSSPTRRIGGSDVLGYPAWGAGISGSETASAITSHRPLIRSVAIGANIRHKLDDQWFARLASRPIPDASHEATTARRINRLVAE